MSVALTGLIGSAARSQTAVDPDIFVAPAAAVVPGAVFESGSASVGGKRAVKLEGVMTETKSVPGSTTGQTLSYRYNALLVDGMMSIAPDNTLRLQRGQIYMKVDEGTTSQASAVPWWYPIVVGQATQSGVISTEFIVQRKPRVIGSDLERIFLVVNASNSTPPPPDVWVCRAQPPSGGGDPYRTTLAHPRSYVLAEQSCDHQLTARTLDPTDGAGEVGVANDVYDSTIQWAVRAGLRPPPSP